MRTRWAAIGAAVAVTLGGGAFGVVRATVSSGDRASYFPITPTRVLDTRESTEITNSTLRLTVEGQIDLVNEVIDRTVVPTDATAVAVNLTVTGGRKNGKYGYVTAYPCTSTADPAPNASSLNFENGVDIANALNITTSSNGSICLYVYGTADLIVDIAGYYADHDHDDRYYTKAQTESALSDKADSYDLLLLETTTNERLGHKIEFSDLLPLGPRAEPSIIDDGENVSNHASLTIGSDGLPIMSYYSQESGLTFAACGDRACQNVFRTSVDSTYGSGRAPSITRGSDGNPVISYLDFANFNLKLATCNDPLCLTRTITIVDEAGSVGWASSISIGFDGNPVIAYHDRTNTTLKVITCSNRTCTSKTTKTIASMGYMSSQNISLAIGIDGNPIVAFTDGDSFDLKVAACDDPTCTTSNLQTIDYAGIVGDFPSIEIGLTGHPIIGYFDRSSEDLKVAVCADPACSTWTTSVIDSDGNVGHAISIAIGRNGLPMFSYYDLRSPFHVKVATCTDIVCTASVRTTVTETSSLVWNTSLAVGTDGTPYVAYIDGTLMDGDLKVAPLWWIAGGR